MRAGILVVGGAAVGAWLVLRRRRHAAGSAPAEHPLDPRAVEPSDDPDDAFARLRTAHDALRAMADDLRDAPTADREQRRAAEAAMQRLVAAAVRHEAAEELAFWPVVRDRLPDGDELAGRADAEELELRRVLHTLFRRRPGDVDWDRLVADLARLAYAHIVFEQVQVWPPLSRVLDRRQRAALGRALAAAEEEAPTRPHLGSAARRSRTKRLGRLVAAVDRGERRRARA